MDHIKEQINKGREIVEEERKPELQKKPFRSYTLDADRKDKGFVVITLKLNSEEQAQLIQDKKLLEQVKSGTAIKQLWKIGSKVVFQEKTREIIETIKGNLRKNKRSGIADFD